MAKIKGVTLKKVSTFPGREGVGLSADVYVNGKKAATFVDYANGSLEGDVQYVSEGMKEVLVRAACAYGNEHPQELMLDYFQKCPERLEVVKAAMKRNYPFLSDEEITDNAAASDIPDSIINAVHGLMEMEKEFKRAVKKGYTHLVECEEDMFSCMEQHLPELEKRPDYVKTYSSLNDFVIS